MSLTVEQDASLLPYNTLGVEARARYLARVGSLPALQQIVSDPQFASLPRLVLGGGSNVLFTRDFPGLVIRLEIMGVERLGEDSGRTLVRVGAGENWHATVARLLDENLPGLENLALIPGSVGAAPIQNIGAYGVELAERFASLRAWNCDASELEEMAMADCAFGYRDSVFKRQASAARVIVDVTLALPRAWSAVTGYVDVEQELRVRQVTEIRPRDVFDAVVAIRRRKLPDPAILGNAGSFFKNPIVDRATRNALIERFASLVDYDIGGGRFKLAAAWLIEACGLRGAVRGRAGIFPRQALVLVNLGGASGAEILALAREVQDAVHARFGIELEPEPLIV
jgi:UDP-N-acetylmuramate dehydrogenase